MKSKLVAGNCGAQLWGIDGRGGIIYEDVAKDVFSFSVWKAEYMKGTLLLAFLSPLALLVWLQHRPKELSFKRDKAYLSLI